MLSVRRDNRKEEKERVKLIQIRCLESPNFWAAAKHLIRASENCDSVQIDGLGADVDGMHIEEEMDRLKVNQVKDLCTNLFLSKKRKKERLVWRIFSKLSNKDPESRYCPLKDFLKKLAPTKEHPLHQIY